MPLPPDRRDLELLRGQLVGLRHGIEAALAQCEHQLDRLIAPPTPDVPQTRLPLDEVARRLGCSVDTVRRRIADRSLPASRDGGRLYITYADLAAYQAAQRPAAPTALPSRSRRRRAG